MQGEKGEYKEKMGIQRRRGELKEEFKGNTRENKGNTWRIREIQEG